MPESTDRIKFLLRAYADNTCNKDELQELFGFIRDARADEALHAFMTREYEMLDHKGKLPELDWDFIFREVIKKGGSPAIEKQATVNRIHFLKAPWFRNVAVVLLIAGAALYLYNIKTTPKELAKQQQPLRLPDIAPGGNKAILTLADGSSIILDNAANGTLAQQAGANVVKSANGEIRYDVAGKPVEGSVTNTMSTPKGGQYQLVLPDGSRVWLNAASSITYPVVFMEKEREVQITGEVYFEITKNKEKPFKVHTAKESITVLGTSFNVNAYSDEQYTKVSLLEGSVKIKEKVLQPGEAYVNGVVIKTDTEKDTDWKNGLFNFQNAGIDEVMRQFSRWYNIEVVYEKGIPDIEFIGKMGRDLNLNTALRLLSKTKVKFRLEEGRKLIILP